MQIDLDNNLWVGHGAGTGLSFYDGIAWQVKLSDYKYLGRALHVDRFNRILTSMAGSFIRYDGTEAMAFYPGIPERYGGNIVAIFVDDDDRIWVSGGGAPFTSAHIARYTNDEKDYQIPNYANTFTQDKNGTLWATNGIGFMYFQENDSTWNEYYVAGVDFPEPEADGYPQIVDMLFDSDNTLWCAYYRVGVMKYDGVAWTIFTPENSGLPIQDTYSVTLDHNEDLWIGTDAGLVRFDRENDWLVFDTSNSGLPHNFVRDVAVAHDNTIWIATEGGGVAKYTGDIITAIDEEAKPEALPTVTSYPNPFNPSTTISFTLPESGHATLTVYNLAGQKVRTLADEPMGVGNHTVVWDGHYDTGVAVAAGIYLSRPYRGWGSRYG